MSQTPITVTYTLEEVLTRLEGKIDKLDQKIDQKSEELNRKIDKLDQKIDQKSEELNRKIDQKSEELNRKIDQKSEELNRKIDQKSEELNRKIDNVAKDLTEFKTETRVEFESVKGDIKNIDTRLSSVEKTVNEIKIETQKNTTDMADLKGWRQFIVPLVTAVIVALLSGLINWTIRQSFG